MLDTSAEKQTKEHKWTKEEELAFWLETEWLDRRLDRPTPTPLVNNIDLST